MIAEKFSGPYAIHWFRRDLRVDGNPALIRSLERFRGKVLGIFCFDAKFLARPDFSHDRFGFFLKTLEALRLELERRGGDLLVLNLGPEEAFPAVFETFRKRGYPLPNAVSFNRDYEPYARERDERVGAMLANRFGVEVHTEADHLLVEPWEIAKEGGGFYRVYSPFAKRWLERFRSPEIRERIALQSRRIRSDFRLKWPKPLRDELGDHLEDFIRKNRSELEVPLPEAGERAAQERLRSFSARLGEYARLRDFPAVDGTSRLSHFIKNGSITTARIIHDLGQDLRLSGRSKFLSELIWREFYYHVLWHQPRVEKEAFLSRMSGIEWENSRELFEAWKHGQTGYPIVDAAMRQLGSTGWMHNRLRMIVASFLTKDLLIDWRWGERWFMERLLDGDLAANNGGWQWAASTGCDPQPYFRIFNPALQSKKFDPGGAFIRTWVPELRTLADRDIHAPRDRVRPKGYPAPIVDHASRRFRAIQIYEAAQVAHSRASRS